MTQPHFIYRRFYLSYQIICAAGRVVIDTSLPLRTNNYSEIISVKPIAISASGRAQFSVKGVNLTRPATRYNYESGKSFLWHT